jgi:hypothetical protein
MHGNLDNFAIVGLEMFSNRILGMLSLQESRD